MQKANQDCGSGVLKLIADSRHADKLQEGIDGAVVLHSSVSTVPD